MKCFIYKNLNKQGFYSFKALEGSYSGLVVGYAQYAIITDVVFKVSERGRQRVISEQRKHVHAGIVGNVVCVDLNFVPKHPSLMPLSAQATNTKYCDATSKVTYNPYLYSTFVFESDKYPILTSQLVNISPVGVFAT